MHCAEVQHDILLLLPRVDALQLFQHTYTGEIYAPFHKDICIYSGKSLFIVSRTDVDVVTMLP